MSAIGAVEDAMRAAEKARGWIGDAVDTSESEGRESVAVELQRLFEQQDAIAAGLSAQREALRPSGERGPA